MRQNQNQNQNTIQTKNHYMPVLLTMCLMLLSPNQAKSFDYYANFDVLFSGIDYLGGTDDFYIQKAQLSGDGSRIVFAGAMTQCCAAFYDYKLFIVDFDGSNLTEIPLPSDPSPNRPTVQVDNLAINEDGSRVFFGTQFTHRLYKVDISENPIIAQVSIVADWDAIHTEFNGGTLLKTIASGDWAYYNYYIYNQGRGDLYRISHNGGTPELVIDQDMVPVNISDGGVGTGLHVMSRFDVSDDGNEIVFSLEGYYDDNAVVHHDWFGWFSKTASGYAQLTPSDIQGLNFGTISGDGSTIVYTDYTSQNKYISINPDASNRFEFEDKSYNFAGFSMTQDGERIFFADNITDTGKISYTRSVKGMPIMPEHDVYSIISQVAGISNDGSRVGFVGNAGGPTRLYAGIFNPDDQWMAIGPKITGLSFTPNHYYDANVPVVMRIPVEMGSADFWKITNENIRNNNYYSTSPWAEFSHGFWWQGAPYDTGTFPDLVANDGEYTASTGANSSYAGVPVCNMLVRVTVGDLDGNMTVAGNILNGSPECVYQNGFE